MGAHERTVYHSQRGKNYHRADLPEYSSRHTQNGAHSAMCVTYEPGLLGRKNKLMNKALLLYHVEITRLIKHSLCYLYHKYEYLSAQLLPTE